MITPSTGEWGAERVFPTVVASPPEPEAWDEEQGFAGPNGMLRVWTDQRGRLTDAIISTHWQERCGSFGIDLENAFGWAFVHVRNHFEQPLSVPELMTPKGCPPPLNRKGSWDRVFAANVATAEPVMARLNSLTASAPDDPGVGDVFSGAEHRVQLTVDVYGRPLALYIDPRFASEASAAALRREIREVCLLQRRGLPPAPTSPREQLVAELWGLTDQLTARLTWELRQGRLRVPLTRDQRDAAAALFRRAVARAIQADRASIDLLKSSAMWHGNDHDAEVSEHFDRDVNETLDAVEQLLSMSDWRSATTQWNGARTLGGEHRDQRVADLMAIALTRAAATITALAGAMDASRLDGVTTRMTMVRSVIQRCIVFSGGVDQALIAV